MPAQAATAASSMRLFSILFQPAVVVSSRATLAESDTETVLCNKRDCTYIEQAQLISAIQSSHQESPTLDPPRTLWLVSLQHAGVGIKVPQRKKLERICRYITLPAVSTMRLSLTRQGKVRHEG